MNAADRSAPHRGLFVALLVALFVRSQNTTGGDLASSPPGPGSVLKPLKCSRRLANHAPRATHRLPACQCPPIILAIGRFLSAIYDRCPTGTYSVFFGPVYTCLGRAMRLS